LLVQDSVMRTFGTEEEEEIEDADWGELKENVEMYIMGTEDWGPLPPFPREVTPTAPPDSPSVLMHSMTTE